MMIPRRLTSLLFALALSFSGVLADYQCSDCDDCKAKCGPYCGSREWVFECSSCGGAPVYACQCYDPSTSCASQDLFELPSSSSSIQPSSSSSTSNTAAVSVTTSDSASTDSGSASSSLWGSYPCSGCDDCDAKCLPYCTQQGYTAGAFACATCDGQGGSFCQCYNCSSSSPSSSGGSGGLIIGVVITFIIVGAVIGGIVYCNSQKKDEYTVVN